MGKRVVVARNKATLEVLEGLMPRGVIVCRTFFAFGVGDMCDGVFVPSGPDGGPRMELMLPAGWTVADESRVGGVILDERKLVVASYRLPVNDKDGTVDTTHSGKPYGNGRLYRAREMITKCASNRAMIREVQNTLRDQTGEVADELRALFAAAC